MTDTRQREGENILVCGVNWIGDTVMSMPAIQTLRKAHREAHLTLLVKSSLAELWKMHAAPDSLMILEPGLSGALAAGGAIQEKNFDRAYVLPHSFRSALVPFLGRVPERIGLPGHWRDWMLTRVVRPRNLAGRRHQAYEYLDLFFPDATPPLERPVLTVPIGAAERARETIAGLPEPCVGLIPGAARGPSKRWPEESFVRLGRRLTGEWRCGVVVIGSPAEQPLCGQIAGAIGRGALAIAGTLTLTEWVALLKACRLVIGNDSGGVHVAAAVGTPVVVIFGVTDPARTGPLGATQRVLQHSAQRARDVARASAAATESLAAVTPDEVYKAAIELLEGQAITGLVR